MLIAVTNEKFCTLLQQPTTVIRRNGLSDRVIVGLSKKQILRRAAVALFRTSRAKTEKVVQKADNLVKFITLEKAQVMTQTHVRSSLRIAKTGLKLALSKTHPLLTLGIIVPTLILGTLSIIKIRIKIIFGVFQRQTATTLSLPLSQTNTAKKARSMYQTIYLSIRLSMSSP